ncbi:MAG: aspartate aminotransferase family protein [Solirubrobacterales bacterium]|nr:aspartate aminotransferase family protein [Solirubrobacterales bacterium]
MTQIERPNHDQQTMPGEQETGYHMSPEEFRRCGHQVVDWVADYMERVATLLVHSAVAPGEILAKLPAAAPEDPESFEAILADLDAIVLPGLAHWQSPGWFAFFPANASPPSVLGELAAAGLGVQGMLWATSPACTEIEMRVLDWLVDLLGLPESWKHAVGPGGGVIQSSASDSTHLAHVVARRLATERGGAVDDAVAYASAESHSSIEKGAKIAGFRHIRLVEVDECFALRPRALERAVSEDRAAGLEPAIVTSTLGTTGTAAVDPLSEVARIARERGLWHHVDAAYGGSTMICPELRTRQRGAELADSYTFNPHKGMFTNFDCSVLWVADRAPLLQTTSILPPYLQNEASAAGAVVDFRDWQVSLGRRFRALKLWWVLRSYGASGIRHHIREHLRLAESLAERVQRHPRLELIAPVSFALVSFRHREGDSATDALARAINAAGDVYVTPSSVNGSRFIRVSIGQTWTGREHVDRLWQIVADAV